MSAEYFNDQWRIPNNKNQSLVSNYYMEFNGINDYIDTGAGVGNALGNSVSDMTISMWVNITPGSSNDGIFKIGAIATDVGEFSIRVATDARIQAYFGASTVHRSYDVLAAGNWNHIAIVKQGTTVSGYVNGSLTTPAFSGDKTAFIEVLRQAVFASKIVSYAQGYVLMREAAKENGWNLNYGGIALMWRGGCIIRSAFLGNIKEAFDANPDISNLLLDDYFKNKVEAAQAGWRRVTATAVTNGIPAPAIGAALTYFDGYRTARLPANLLQAQRDYFGAHTYERIDKARGEYFHTNWTGRGGDTASTTYDV